MIARSGTYKAARVNASSAVCIAHTLRPAVPSTAFSARMLRSSLSHSKTEG